MADEQATASAPAASERAPRPPWKPATPDSDRYLAYLEVSGGYSTFAKNCQILKIYPDSVKRWRREVIGFKIREQAIKVAHKGKPLSALGAGGEDGAVALLDTPLRINPDGLSERQLIYLTHLYQTQHRTEACENSRIPWREVRGWIEAGGRFGEEYHAWVDEQTIGNLDSISRKGAAGDVAAARMALTAAGAFAGSRGGGRGGAAQNGDPISGVNREGSRQASDDWLRLYARRVEGDDAYKLPPREQVGEAEDPAPRPAEDPAGAETFGPDDDAEADDDEGAASIEVDEMAADGVAVA